MSKITSPPFFKTSDYSIKNSTFINLVTTSYNSTVYACVDQKTTKPTTTTISGNTTTVNSGGNISLSVLTTRVLAEMLGYFFAPSVVPIPPALPYKNQVPLDSVADERIFNFFNFWNKSDASDFFTSLGQDFQKISGITSGGTKYSQQTQDFNNFVTYVVVLGLSIPTSPNGIILSSPLDIFTPKSSPGIYNNAAENLMTFLRNCGGLGNVPVSDVTIPQSYSTNPSNIWNQGYVDIFCTQVFDNYCKEQVPPLETSSQTCVSGFRKKLANSTTALNWCGCFAPLSSFVLNALKNVTNKQSCDSFCYREGGIKLYNPPSKSTDGSIRDITCSGSQVCIIDNNNINANDSQGSITFNQVCKCSSNQACLCYIDTSTPGLLDNVSNSEGGGMNSSVNFSQKCSNAICFQIDPVTGAENEVKCNGVNPGRTGDVFSNSSTGMTTLENYERIDSTFWFFILFFLIVLLIYQFSYLEIKLF